MHSWHAQGTLRFIQRQIRLMIREMNGANSHQEGCKITYLWEPRNIYSFSRGELGLLMKHPVMYTEHESFTGHRAHRGFHRIPAYSSKPDCWELSAWPSCESNIHRPAETTPSWRLSCSFGRGFTGMMRTEGYVFLHKRNLAQGCRILVGNFQAITFF